MRDLIVQMERIHHLGREDQTFLIEVEEALRACAAMPEGEQREGVEEDLREALALALARRHGVDGMGSAKMRRFRVALETAIAIARALAVAALLLVCACADSGQIDARSIQGPVERITVDYEDRLRADPAIDPVVRDARILLSEQLRALVLQRASEGGGKAVVPYAPLSSWLGISDETMPALLPPALVGITDE